MSYLYYGQDKQDLKLPPLELYVANRYKQYPKPEISNETLKSIIMFNSLCYKAAEKVSYTLFCFKSLINHNRKSNLQIKYIGPDVALIYAGEDIEVGTELLADYCDGVQDLN